MLSRSRFVSRYKTIFPATRNRPIIRLPLHHHQTSPRPLLVLYAQGAELCSQCLLTPPDLGANKGVFSELCPSCGRKKDPVSPFPPTPKLPPRPHRCLLGRPACLRPQSSPAHPASRLLGASSFVTTPYPPKNLLCMRRERNFVRRAHYVTKCWCVCCRCGAKQLRRLLVSGSRSGRTPTQLKSPI